MGSTEGGCRKVTGYPADTNLGPEPVPTRVISVCWLGLIHGQKRRLKGAGVFQPRTGKHPAQVQDTAIRPNQPQLRVGSAQSSSRMPR